MACSKPVSTNSSQPEEKHVDRFYNKWDFEAKNELMLPELVFEGFQSDITIKLISVQWKFQAHKLFLMMRSKFFYNLFTKDDSLKNFTIDIVGDAYELRPYKAFLLYLYKGHIAKWEVSSYEHHTLMRLAVKYEVPGLVQLCREEIINGEILNWQTYELAKEVGDEGLQEICIRHICRSDLFNREPIRYEMPIKEYKEQDFITVLTRDDLFARDELQVFEAAMKWGKHQCKSEGPSPEDLRKQLANVLPLIRFPLMKGEDFVLYVVGTKILNPEEEMELLRYLLLEPSSRVLLPKPKFPTRPRIRKIPSPGEDEIGKSMVNRILYKLQLENGEERVYVPEKILTSRQNGLDDKVRYLIQWRELGPEHNQWEWGTDIHNQELLVEYMKQTPGS